MMDDFSETSYIKNFTVIFKDTFRNFFSPCLLRQELRTTYDSKIVLHEEEPTHEVRKNYYERHKAEELDGIDSYEKNQKSKKKKI